MSHTRTAQQDPQLHILGKWKEEDEERKFWATGDSTESIDWEKAKRTVLPNLKPSLKNERCQILNCE